MPRVVSVTGRTTAWLMRLSRMYFSVSFVLGLRFCVPRRRMMVKAVVAFAEAGRAAGLAATCVVAVAVAWALMPWPPGGGRRACLRREAARPRRGVRPRRAGGRR